MASQKKQNMALPEGVTQEKINEWKKKYGDDKIRLLCIRKGETPENGEFTCVARVPDKTVVNEYMKFADKKPDRANGVLIKNCLLTGQEDVQGDDNLYFGAISQIADLIPLPEARTEKL